MAAVPLSLFLSQSLLSLFFIYSLLLLFCSFGRRPFTSPYFCHGTARHCGRKWREIPRGFHSTTYSSQSLLRCIRCPRVDMILSLTLVTVQARNWPYVCHVRRAMTTLESAAAVE